MLARALSKGSLITRGDVYTGLRLGRSSEPTRLREADRNTHYARYVPTMMPRNTAPMGSENLASDLERAHSTRHLAEMLKVRRDMVRRSRSGPPQRQARDHLREQNAES